MIKMEEENIRNQLSLIRSTYPRIILSMGQMQLCTSCGRPFDIKHTKFLYKSHTQIINHHLRKMMHTGVYRARLTSCNTTWCNGTTTIAMEQHSDGRTNITWRSILMCNKSTSAGTSLEGTPMFAHITLHRTFNPLGSNCPLWQDVEAAS